MPAAMKADRLFPETVAERLQPVRARLLDAVDKANENLDRAHTKLQDAEKLLEEFDLAMEQQAAIEAKVPVMPRIDLTTGEVLD